MKPVHVMEQPDGSLQEIDITWRCEHCRANIFNLLPDSKVEVKYPFCVINGVVLHLKCRSSWRVK
jgi:hypothetical protein